MRSTMPTFIVGRIFEFFDTLLELYHALPERPRYGRQSAAEQQQYDAQEDHNLPNAKAEHEFSRSEAMASNEP